MRENNILKIPFVFNLKYTALSHGWVRLSPFEWDDESHKLSRYDNINGSCVKWEVCQVGNSSLHYKADLRLSEKQRTELIEKIKYCLMIDWNPNDIFSLAKTRNSKIWKYLKDGGGRLLRGSTFFEDFCKTVFTINTSWGNTVVMAKAFIDYFGNGCFPSPKIIIEAGENNLQKHGRTGYRAKIIHVAAKFFIDNGIVDNLGRLNHKEIERQTLIGIKGIGPYAADHLRVLQCDYSRIPVDSEVSSYCQEKFNLVYNKKEDAINNYFKDWHNYKFLAYKIHRIIERDNWIG